MSTQQAQPIKYLGSVAHCHQNHHPYRLIILYRHPLFLYFNLKLERKRHQPYSSQHCKEPLTKISLFLSSGKSKNQLYRQIQNLRLSRVNLNQNIRPPKPPWLWRWNPWPRQSGSRSQC
jgi:hypothetical protein